MADGLTFMSGATYSDTGQALNQTAQGEIAGLGIQGNSYTSYVPPNPSNPSSSSYLGTPPLNIPPGTTPDNGASLVASTAGSYNAANPPPASSTPALDQATTNYNDAYNAYQTDIQNTPDESKMLAQQEQNMGIPGQLDQISQLKTELAGLTASYNNQYQNIGAKGIESGVPAVFYQGEQAAQQRQASVVLGGKAAVLSALQGNYQQAEAQARQVANMQFKAAEDKIANAYNFLKLNQDTLTKAQADAIKANAGQQSLQIADQKANVKTALSSGVQTAFWTKPDGTVIRTSDGYAFHNQQEAFAAGVLPDFSNAPKINPVGKSETRKIGSTTYHIIYDQSGNILSKTALNGTGKGGTPIAKTTLKQDVQSMSGALSGRKGQDGYISPQDYKTAQAAWQKAGYSAASFKTNFGNLINPADKQDYQ